LPDGFGSGSGFLGGFWPKNSHKMASTKNRGLGRFSKIAINPDPFWTQVFPDSKTRQFEDAGIGSDFFEANLTPTSSVLLV